MATITEIDAQIASIERQLNSGVTDMSSGSRRRRVDLNVLNVRLDVLRRERAALATPEAVPVRRILTYPADKGL